MKKLYAQLFIKPLLSNRKFPIIQEVSYRKLQKNLDIDNQTKTMMIKIPL